MAVIGSRSRVTPRSDAATGCCDLRGGPYTESRFFGEGAGIAVRKGDTALRRANQLLNRAATGWRQYRNNGLIAGEQRLESGISAKFRSQAKLLAEAQDDARKGLRIYAQLKIEDSARSS